MIRITLQDGRVIHCQAGQPQDIPGIIDLYQRVYHGKYTLKEVSDPEAIRSRLDDPNYFWTLAFLGKEIIGSVIFSIDPVNKLGKLYAAVVLPEFRGQDVMRSIVRQGLERLTERTRTCDVLYATTRTVSVAPQVVLEHLDFFPMGIFPNVRKVESFETHGLEIYFRRGCLDLRRKRPQLVPEIREFYKVVRDVLHLEDEEKVDLPLSDPRKMGDPLPFEIDDDARRLRKRFDALQNKDQMDKVFFPFMEPNLLFHTPDRSAEFFVNFNDADGFGVIIGYKIGTTDLRRALMWFAEVAARSGMRYIEMLVNAFRPDLQRIAVDARFLPTAYFPAMRMTERGEREDYAVFSRSFESLDFMNMNLVDTNRRFLDAFMKCWYEMLVRCQPDFDEEWRIG
ncbi:MAG: GNAT family N-acetyltransferase [Candidatus Riflebacteria bacterium]|nr:GNAT family N-acetyltransferase [Candidatus Riflebacteria bacterium]